MHKDISVILICLNDAHCIAELIISLKNSSYRELIIVDGGSTDDTVQIAQELTENVYITEKGMLTQTLYGLEKAQGSFIFLAECDNVYPDNFLDKLLYELETSDFDGIQGSLKYRSTENFFAKGHGLFLEVHHNRKGPRNIIAGPQLWRRSSIYTLFENLEFGQGFCFDTQRAEVCSKLGLKVGLGHTLAFEGGYVDYQKFKARHRNYGYGDYEFYQNNKKGWSTLRKVKSITHIARTYWIKYPYLSLKHSTPYFAIPYFFLIGAYRYYFWFKKIIMKA